MIFYNSAVFALLSLSLISSALGASKREPNFADSVEDYIKFLQG